MTPAVGVVEDGSAFDALLTTAAVGDAVALATWPTPRETAAVAFDVAFRGAPTDRVREPVGVVTAPGFTAWLVASAMAAVGDAEATQPCV